MAINPVEMISRARRRIARIAAIEASSYFIAPALTAVVLAALLPFIGAMSWERMGYIMSSDVMTDMQFAMLAAGVLILMAGAFFGWRAFSASDDFISAAVHVDVRVRASEQVVTLASLANPDAPEVPATSRSPLFPILWRNVIGALDAFDPDKEFTLDLGRPVKRSWLPTAIVLIFSVVAMFAFVRTPTPLEQTAIELRELADKIDAAAKTPDDKQLAEKIKKVASNLTNPKVTPEEKKKELDKVMAEVEKKETKAGDQTSAATGASKGSSGAGASSASTASGASEGKGEGGQSQGQGKGNGKGEGKGGTGNSKNQSGDKKNGQKNGSGTADSIQLKNELAKAQAQVQTEDLAANQAPNKPAPEAKTAQAPQPGKDPNKQGGSSKDQNQKGSAPMPVPQAGNNAPNPMASGQGPKPSKGGGSGDTHLGEFPTAANYERFLKPGEKGAGMHLNDARYVVFKIPSGPSSEGEGKTVIDTERTRATTAYTNAPLPPTSDTAPPDERQLVPPRYRELIR